MNIHEGPYTHQEPDTPSLIGIILSLVVGGVIIVFCAMWMWTAVFAPDTSTTECYPPVESAERHGLVSEECKPDK